MGKKLPAAPGERRDANGTPAAERPGRRFPDTAWGAYHRLYQRSREPCGRCGVGGAADRRHLRAGPGGSLGGEPGYHPGDAQRALPPGPGPGQAHRHGDDPDPVHVPVCDLRGGAAGRPFGRWGRRSGGQPAGHRRHRQCGHRLRRSEPGQRCGHRYVFDVREPVLGRRLCEDRRSGGHCHRHGDAGYLSVLLQRGADHHSQRQYFPGDQLHPGRGLYRPGEGAPAL